MLATTTLFLAAAVLFVPLFKRLGLGAVLGYLAAGLVIGPGGLGLIGDVESILHISEFGVVLLLFVIGLELQPSRLWLLRSPVFGTGGLQVLLSALALGGVALALDQTPVVALVIGFGLAMSSTALVLQMLGERKELTDKHGRAAFAVLLFQDLSVIPFLALVPLMAAQPGREGGGDWMPALFAIGAIVGVIALGRYALRPVLRAIAAVEMPEVFTAAALLLVAGTALLMEGVGLSLSLGAFLAGVLLADSEYRHELQADIEPFKGLLLGLFFMAVGMGANVHMVLSQPLLVLGLVVILLTIKGGVLFGVGRFTGLNNAAARRLAFAASQGGEFAFVLFGVAATAGILASDLQGLLVVTVTLSMILTPPLYALQSRWGQESEARPFDEIVVPETPVVIAGFGPFGQIIGRVLRLRGVPYTVLERDWQQVDFLRQLGSPVFYSDATRLEVLRAAHVGKAQLFVISVAEPEDVSLRIAETVRKHFPNVRVFAVARTRQHAMHLMDLGVHKIVRRAYFSSLHMTRDVLIELGDAPEKVDDILVRFQRFDQDTLLRQQAIHRDPERMRQSAKEASKELEQLFEDDRRSEPAAVRPADSA
ncbi:Kef-type potassium/proton antiporter (CPA2 family) [Panacagrimonas perspica]|uniref:Kef-type potassium/proton antiporter (CPA2 family) n=1 Tax=Panacagrimonas perspica TaxID=381431 RepID=A0A4V3URZ0_9GAMM|nr:monovalent cation:proton antiporter-2 (CPA2) family protein [Panacagrimonas perspica]TDU24300.1 Kef-type potassium/proton antiporter (CPA2 family) [Panacagrimonas perspica]THD04701.1 glutathione-regulated potassium-efflux system protein KefB [Panacagrimonas perspica]